MQSSYFPLAKFWNIQPSFHKQLDAIQAFVTLSPWQPTLVFLPGASQGQGSPMGCRLWGRTESDMTEATAAAAEAAVCGILAPWPGMEPALPALEGEVLATGSPGKSLIHF